MADFLLDENIPYSLHKLLLHRGLDSVHIADVEKGYSDPEIIRLAVDEDRIVVTRDRDFLGLGKHLPGLFFIQLENRQLLNRLEIIAGYLERESRDLRGKIVILVE